MHFEQRSQTAISTLIQDSSQFSGHSHDHDQGQALFNDAYNVPGRLTDQTQTAKAIESFVAFQQGDQQTTVINADWIRSHFQGNQQTQLLELFRNNHISEIRLGPAGGDGTRPITINFDCQMNIPGAGDFQSLSGTLQITENGFRISNPRMDGQPIRLGGTTINDLEHNSSWLCELYGNNTLPIPGQSTMCRAIRRALGGL